MNPKQDRPHRPIRSYVLRQGRLTRGQQRAFEQFWPRFGLEWQPAPYDLPVVFGNDHPVYLEIGFGNGESLAEMAGQHPGRNYLGVEVHAPGVGHLLMRLDELGLPNVRIFRHDAIEVLRDCIPDDALAGVYLFFPDPWHKKRHHKRRIVRPDFLTLLARKLRPGGIFHAATDWEDYAHHMRSVLTGHPAFRNTAEKGDFVPRPAYRPLTKFERRGQRLGHGVWDLIFERKG